VQRVLLIPDRFTDWRMWAGIPDRLARRAAVSHLDQLISLPWAAAPDAVVGLARSQAPDGWDVVVAAGQACPFAVALAAAGLAHGLVLLQPEIPFDRIPEDVDLGPATPDPDAAAPYEVLIGAMHAVTPEEWRELLTQTIRQTVPRGVPDGELDLMLQLAGDHAAEVRAELLDFERAELAERYLPSDAPGLWRRERGRWLDQLATLTLPVVAIVPGPERFVGETIGRITRNLETLVVTEQGIVPPSTTAARDQAATAIERLLDRLSRPVQLPAPLAKPVSLAVAVVPRGIQPLYALTAHAPFLA